MMEAMVCIGRPGSWREMAVSPPWWSRRACCTVCRVICSPLRAEKGLQAGGAGGGIGEALQQPLLGPEAVAAEVVGVHQEAPFRLQHGVAVRRGLDVHHPPPAVRQDVVAAGGQRGAVEDAQAAFHGPLLQQDALEGVVGQGVTPGTVGQGVLDVGHALPVEFGIADQPPEGGHHGRGAVFRAHPYDHPEGFHLRGLILVLPDQDVAPGRGPLPGGEGGTALHLHAPGSHPGYSGHLGPHVDQEGGGEGDAGPFGDPPNLFHQVRSEGLEGGQEGQRPGFQVGLCWPPGGGAGRAVCAVPGGQGAQPRFGPQHPAQGLGVGPHLLPAGLPELPPPLPRAAPISTKGKALASFILDSLARGCLRCPRGGAL